MACDNVGCRRGGCQGRPPELPLFQAVRLAQTEPAAKPLAALQPAAEQPDNPALLAA
jgi:hypothetical protein